MDGRQCEIWEWPDLGSALSRTQLGSLGGAILAVERVYRYCLPGGKKYLCFVGTAKSEYYPRSRSAASRRCWEAVGFRLPPLNAG